MIYWQNLDSEIVDMIKNPKFPTEVIEENVFYSTANPPKTGMFIVSPSDGGTYLPSRDTFAFVSLYNPQIIEYDNNGTVEQYKVRVIHAMRMTGLDRNIDGMEWFDYTLYKPTDTGWNTPVPVGKDDKEIYERIGYTTDWVPVDTKIINNLVDGGESSALSAEQGKAIKNLIDNMVQLTSEEKLKLAGIEEGANNYTLPLATTDTVGGVKVDGVTAVIENDKLVIKQLDGLSIGAAELEQYLSGTSSNVQNQIDTVATRIETLAKGMEYKGKVESYADLIGISSPQAGWLVVVLADETKNGDRSLYVFNDNSIMWDYIGTFTFSTRFISMDDTPASYIGSNGKFVRSDETNTKVVFSDITWSDILNKPEIINRLGITAEGKLTIDNIVYPVIPTPAPKEYLFAYNTPASTYVKNDLIKFEVSSQGSIQRTTTSFTLKKGKVYRISFSGVFEMNDWVGVGLYDITNNKTASEFSFARYFNSSKSAINVGDNGLFECIITPQETKNFGLYITSMSTSNTSVVLRDRTGYVMITEI